MADLTNRLKEVRYRIAQAIEAESHMVILPAGFGKDWMTRNAADLFRILVTFGNVDASALIRAMRLNPTSERANTRSVESAMLRLRTSTALSNPPTAQIQAGPKA